MATISVTTARPVNGGNSDDLMTGNDTPNVMSGGSGHDTLLGAGGDDVLKGDAGRDQLDGGAGSDRVDGHSDDDTLVYVAADNAGAEDWYDGGAGVDTLRLVLTREEWMRPAVQDDVARFLAFIADHANASGQATAETFDFLAFKLHAGKFERLEVTVDGVALDPRDEAVTLASDSNATHEDGSAAGAVLANDDVPDLVRSVALVVPPAHGSLAFNADGTYVYTPGAEHNALARGEIAVETFQYRVTDADFDSAIAVVTVTVTGTNDGPVVTNTAQALIGAVQEDGVLAATGQLGATDVDHGATQTWTVQGATAGSYGSIAVDGTGRWTYTLDNAAHQDLAQGESHDEVFTVRVSDEHGAFADQTVTVTVAGANDGPVITGGPASAAVTEDGAGQATGQLLAADPDHGAQQVWTVVGGTPSGNADYRFTMDSLTVTRNGATMFADDFADGVPPPSATGPYQYVGVGVNHLAETGGRLVFDSDAAVPFVGVGTPDPIVGQNAILRSNIDPSSGNGLKSGADFTVSGVFDLIVPDSPRETYGLRLTDRLVGGNGTPPDQLGDNVVDLRVIARLDGSVGVLLRHLDFVADTSTLLQAIALAPPAGADQIRLNLAHSAAQPGQVQASFDYLSNGVVVGTQLFSAMGQIFQGENWTRAEVIASAPAMTDSTLGGTYGSLNVGQSGAWTYDLDHGRAETQALAAGQHASDVFTVQVTDEFGAFDTRTVSVEVTGTNDAPVIQIGPVSRALAEDAGVSAGRLTATGEGQFSDVDLTDTHTMSVALAGAVLSGGGPLPAALAADLAGAMTATLLDPATGDGHAQYRWDFSAGNAATQFLAAGQTVQATYQVVATDPHGASATQQVTITIAGSNDAPVVTAADVTAAVTEAIAPAGVLGDSGTLAFTDADHADTHTIGAVSATAGALGTLTAAVSTDTTGSGAGGTVAWNYSVAAAAVEYLAAGATKTESFTFNVLDGHGAGVARTVTATVTGTNDGPVIGAADTTGAVTAQPTQPQAPAQPLVFTVQQFLGYQSNSLASLRSYAASNAASYTVQTNVIDYTDDPGGFAGELPGSTRWPAAQAQGVFGTGGINNAFFARITADFSVGVADTYTFRTFNDDGVFLLIDNQLIIADTGYHPEAPFNGSIALQPGNHTIELFFYEGGGEASLEFSARTSTGSFGLVGANGGGLGGAQVMVRDSGTIAFADVDLSDVHLVSAAPVGGTLGTLSVVKDSDSTGAGAGGQLTWNYSVANASIAYLAAGQTRTESFTVTVDDQHGGVATRQVDVTVTGTNDAPVAARDANSLTVKPATTAQPTFVNWVDWTSATPGSVAGTIDLGNGQTIGVTYSGEFAFTQTNGGTYFYTGPDGTYQSAAVQNRPGTADIIALSQATQKTLTFSQPVNDLFFAIVSLNGNGYLFDQDFDIMSYGPGFFGTGGATRVALPDGRFSVVGSGELHGVLRIDGAIQSLTWTSQSPEYWNGFTVGTYGKAQTATAAGNLLANDSDVDGDLLTLTAVNGQAIVGNSITLDLASGARVQVNRDGTYLYDEDGAFAALGSGQTSVDSFQYTVSDGHGGTAVQQVEITIVGAAG